MNNPIQGVMPVVIMPYTQDGELAWNALHDQIRHMAHVGCDGVVVGQVSEVLRLSDAERRQMAEEIVKAADGKICAIMSTGGESTRQAVSFSQHADQAGCDALLVMHPSIMALDDGQMLDYYRAVIEAVNCPILVHHAKSMAKRPLSIDVQAQLLDLYGPDKVMFKPEAAPTPPRVSQLMEATGGKARIFEGDGGMMLADTFQRGVTGVIPATEIAEIVVTLWQLLRQGRDEEARRIAYPLSYLMCHMMNSIDCYLGISKHLLKRRGLMENTYIRTPIDYHVDPETLREVERVYDELLDLALSTPVTREAAQ
jgi:4-hydroxy-tetrahydrodipicolinate synthase